MSQQIKRLLPRSLFGRALLIIVSPLVILQIISTYIFYEQHWETMRRRLNGGVAGDVSLVIEVLEHTQGEAARAELFADAMRNTGIAFTYHEGAILPNRPPPAWPTAQSRVLMQALNERLPRPTQIDDESDSRQVFIDVQLPDAVLHASVGRKRLFSSTTYVFILWMIGSSLILFAVAGLFMRNQVRPIKRLARAAEMFGKGQETGPFKPEGASEVRQAALEFNRMRERITRQITQRTEMLAGVSHDLRTPLTRMKLQLAMMGDGPDIQGMISDVGEMERMVDGYLAFARGAGAEAAVATELRPLVEEVVGGARREGRSVDLAVGADVSLQLRPNAVRRGITNLVSNACRYGRTVAVKIQQAGGMIEVTVDDDGPGIPADRREEAFKPFYRLDPSRNPSTGGVGLGLTIARDVFRGHGGDVVLGDSPLGGLRATAKLPI